MSVSKHIVLLSTGGTIASAPGPDGRDVSGALPGEVLAEQVRLPAHLRLEVRSILQKPSNAVDLVDLATIAACCRELIAQGSVAGIVITHGTDTLEDTAYYLDCVLDSPDIPVVVTGAQRVPHALGSDAYANLANAVYAAADEACRGLGVLVAFNQSLFAAAFVRKVSSFQLHGFDAPGLGAMGMVDNGRVHLLQRPMRQSLLPADAPLPRVDVIPAMLGADVALIEAVIASAPAGLVIDGLGRGHVPPGWMPALARAVEAGIAVLVCSSTLSGPTHQSYQFSGALHDLEHIGAIGISHLSARKARLRLGLLLAAGITDPAAVRAHFEWQSTRCHHPR